LRILARDVHLESNPDELRNHEHALRQPRMIYTCIPDQSWNIISVQVLSSLSHRVCLFLPPRYQSSQLSENSMSDPRVDTMAIERKYGLHAPAEKVTRPHYAVRDSPQLSSIETLDPACACVPQLAPASVVDAASYAYVWTVMGMRHGYPETHGYPASLCFLNPHPTPTQVWSVTPVWQPQAKGKQLVTLDNAGSAGEALTC
jgi:hypothetical protein